MLWLAVWSFFSGWTAVVLTGSMVMVVVVKQVKLKNEYMWRSCQVVVVARVARIARGVAVAGVFTVGIVGSGRNKMPVRPFHAPPLYRLESPKQENN